MPDFDYKTSDLYDYILEIERKEKFQRKIRRYSLFISIFLSVIIFIFSWYKGASRSASNIDSVSLSEVTYIRISSDQFNPQAAKELFLTSGKHIIIESRHGISNDTLSSVKDIDRFSRIDYLLKNSTRKDTRSSDRSGPFFLADQMPEFPGGQDALARYLQSQLQYPAEAKFNQVEGSVQIRFIVEADGSISQPEVIKGIGFGCDEEAIRLISRMPLWEPGINAGNSVPVYKSLTIQFQLL